MDEIKSAFTEKLECKYRDKSKHTGLSEIFVLSEF